MDDAVFHVISRTAIESYFTDFEKDVLLKTLQHFSKIYFVKVYGFCIMGNHFHLIAQMNPPDSGQVSDQDFKKRHKLYMQDCVFSPKYKLDSDENKAALIRKWSDLSEYVRDIKLSFTRWYNRRHQRRGYLWGGRFKSVLLEKGEALLNCMAYIDLNPVRAGIVNVPEKYRWCSLYHHAVKRNKDALLSMDYASYGGVYPTTNEYQERFLFYRKWIYVKGATQVINIKGKNYLKQSRIPEAILHKEKRKQFKYTIKDQFLHRCRYFSDSVIIGSEHFVSHSYSIYKNKLFDKRKRRFKTILHFPNIYSMRDLKKQSFGK